MEPLQKISDRFSKLTKQEQESIVDELEKMLITLEAEVKDKQLEYRKTSAPSCPDCQSKNFRRNGYQKGLQLYLCKDCGRNYRETTGTLVAWLKKPEKLKPYLRNMLLGYSIRKCASETGISIQTSFDWRHKILAAFGKAHQETKFSGICESDDIFIPYSEKGNKCISRKPRKRGKSIIRNKKQGVSDDQVAIIATVDRQGNQSMMVSARGRISKKDIEKVLNGKLKPGTVLCTDSHRSYTAFTNGNNIKHVKIKTSKGNYKKGIYHVQHVNQKAADLKKWLSGFNGVSTKYLQNYLNWYALKDKIEKSALPTITAIGYAVISFSAWNDFYLIRSNANII